MTSFSGTAPGSTMEALACQRDAFSIPRDRHYINCAYMGPLPRLSEAAGIEGIRRKACPADIVADDFFDDSNEVRRLFARLVGSASPERVALVPSVSYGVATAARNTSVEPGQNIVVTQDQFPGNVYSWRRLIAEAGAELRTVRSPDRPHRGEEWSARLVEAIDGGTALVSIGSIHWTDGTLFDLEAIGSRAREVGAAFLVDGTQSVGARPFDVGRVRPDALFCAGYKWLLGPYSLSLAYFGERYLNGVPLEETWSGRRGSEDFQGLVDYVDEYQPGAVRFDVGERSNFALLPPLLESLKLILEWQPHRIEDYCQDLTRELVDAAVSLGFTVEEPAWRAKHLFGLRLPTGASLDSLNAALERHRVSVSLRGTAVRVSPNVYNHEGDVAALINALREV